MGSERRAAGGIRGELGAPDGLSAVTGDTSDFDVVQAEVQSAVSASGCLDVGVAKSGFAMHDAIATG